VSGKQTVCQVGSVEDDPEGYLMFQLRDNMQAEAIGLQIALDGTRDKYKLSVPSLLSHMFKPPLFEEGRKKLFEHGIEAYFSNDHVKTIHVLVPQIEHCLRRLLGMLDKPTTKHGRSGVDIMMEKSLNDILEREESVKSVLGDDATFFLRFLLCDPRGYNLRNNLSHGLMEIDEFHRLISDRLIHVLLFLSTIQASD
jgi:hypothetical protein